MATFLPAAQMPRNAMLNFEPLNRAIDDYQNAARGAEQETYNRRQNAEIMGMRRQEFAGQQQDRADRRRALRVQQLAGLAQMVDSVQDPQQRAAQWNTLLQSDPRLGRSLPEQYRDPINGPKFLIAEARGYQDPLQRQQQEAQLQLTQAQIARANRGPEYEIAQREQLAQRYGLQPGTPAYQQYVMTGNLNPNLVKQAESRDDIGGKIAGGIDRLAQVPQDFDSTTLNTAIGPLQGDPTSYLGTVARGLGATWNGIVDLFGGGRGSTTEVRNRIAGDTEALAASIKPLIRAPGEGVWTDADQARLVAVVGNLATARDAAEYYRALEGVRQRVEANFGIQLPPINIPEQFRPQSTGGSPQPAPNRYQSMSDNDLLRELGVTP